MVKTLTMDCLAGPGETTHPIMDFNPTDGNIIYLFNNNNNNIIIIII